MTPLARAAAAIEVLADVAARHRPAVDALKDWGLAHRFAGSGDRVAIGNLVLDALRRRATNAWRMGSDEPRALVLATLAGAWGMPVEAIEAGISTERHAPEPLTDEERSALAAAEQAPMPDLVAADLPERFGAALARALGDRLVAEGRAMAERAPLDLRVNSLKAERPQVLKALARFGPAATPFSPVGIRLPVGAGPAKPPHVQSEEGYVRGRFEIQDEGSQLAALLAGARPGDQVLDLCAGGGGKTLALAAEMGNRGQIHAYDSDRRRFGDILERLRRAGVHNAQVRRPGEGALDDLAGRMNLVLVDAPCTGSGTWRRRPDAKWRLAEGALAQRIEDQRGLLTEAAGFVAPGGRLVYVTCSLFAEENEDRIAEFLAGHPGFGLADPAGAWLAALGTALPAEELAVPVGAHGRALRLTPATAGTDGFFVAAMERRG